MIEIDEYLFFQYAYLWVNKSRVFCPNEYYMRIQLYAAMMGWG